MALAGAQPPRLPRPRLPGAAAGLLAPALLATELALIPVSIAGAGGGRSWPPTSKPLRWLPRLLRERRQLQATRTVSAAEFASWLTADLDSPFIAAGRPAPALAACSCRWGYWRVATSASTRYGTLPVAQIGWLVGRIRISLTSTPGRCSSA